MADQIVRSPNSLTRDQPHGRRGEIQHAGIYRGDGGHIAGHVGKGTRTNPKLSADHGETNAPVQGGRREVIE